MVVTASGDALHLLRLILDTPWHEGHECDDQQDKAVLAVIVIGGPDGGGQDFGEHVGPSPEPGLSAPSRGAASTGSVQPRSTC